MNYYCAVCKKPVVVVADQAPEKECEHADAPIIAELSAVVYGESGSSI